MTNKSPVNVKKAPVTAALKKRLQPKSLKQRVLEKELGKVGVHLTCQYQQVF